MIKLRLKRQGKKFNPHYRIVVVEARSKRDGESIEDLGHYSPMSKELVIDSERAKYWIGSGAQPTKTVEYLLVKEGVLSKPSKKSAFKKEAGQKTKDRRAAREEKKNKPQDKVVAEEPVEEPETPAEEESAE